MELITVGKEFPQTLAEQAASYRLGQMALRQLDRVLWLLEKTARWAVPPPLDDRPQPELVRPLPWVFFLWLLIVMRVTRESISLVNLVMGKPPLRAGDIVMYIQGKRRYLRTLKYQGNRLMRARSGGAGATSTGQTWYSSMRSLFEFTVCFRRAAERSTAAACNSEQILVVTRKSSGEVSPAAPNTENTMERLIEKMMVDLNADSDDDSSYTLTNATSVKTDSEPDSDQETVFSIDHSASTPQKPAISTPEKHGASSERDTLNTPGNGLTDSSHENDRHNANIGKESSLTESSEIKSGTLNDTTLKSDESNSTKEDVANATLKDSSKEESPATPPRRAIPSLNKKAQNDHKNNNKDTKSSLGANNGEQRPTEEPKSGTTKEETLKFIQSEKCSTKPQGKTQKLANGRAIENSSSKKKENTRH